MYICIVIQVWGCVPIEFAVIYLDVRNEGPNSPQVYIYIYIYTYI